MNITRIFLIVVLIGMELPVIAHEAQDLVPNLVFHKSKETLQKVMDIIAEKKKGAYLRLGDGEVYVASRNEGTGWQKQSEKLTQEMKEVFALNGPTILKSMPLNCPEFGGFEDGMFVGYHIWTYDLCKYFVQQVKPLWGAEITDVYSQVALHFMAVHDINFCTQFIKFIKNSNCTVFVGNYQVPEAIRKKLFGEKCKFVPCTPTDSYSQVDEMERACLAKIAESSEYQVLVFATGPTSNVLQKRIWNKADNVFLFNFGSLIDFLCGWTTREWIQLVKNRFSCDQFFSLIN